MFFGDNSDERGCIARGFTPNIYSHQLILTQAHCLVNYKSTSSDDRGHGLLESILTKYKNYHEMRSIGGVRHASWRATPKYENPIPTKKRYNIFNRITRQESWRVVFSKFRGFRGKNDFFRGLKKSVLARLGYQI